MIEKELTASVEQHEETKPRSNAIEEIVGTIDIADLTGRKALRPEPSLDPNDPLVSRQ
jgi:hypothetical protein